MKKKKNKHQYEQQSDCIYNFNQVCLQNRYSRCLNRLNCNFYTKFSSNKFCISISKISGKIILKLKIEKVGNNSFCKDEFNYIWKYKFMYANGSYTYIILTLNSLESYVHFLFNNFDTCINLDNGCFTIDFIEPIEILKILDVPLRNVSDFIQLKRSLKNKYGRIVIDLKISKTEIFHITKKLKEVSAENHNIVYEQQISKKIKPQPNKDVIITAVIISDNRKCTYSNHIIYDVLAKANVVTPNGKIILATLPAAYCDV